MTLETSTCPPVKELVTVLEPSPARPPAHFLLFLPPTSTPPASCGFIAKFTISGRVSRSPVIVSFQRFTPHCFPFSWDHL